MSKSSPSDSTAVALARLLPDLPADRDKLKFEFEGLAKTLAELSLNPSNRTPFTVVVRGGWGRGKTTLLKRAQRLVEKPTWVDGGVEVREVETLWFNAWKYPDEETVLAGLLGALLDKLHKGKLIDQLKEAVLKYRGSAAISVLRAAAPGPLKELFEIEDRFRGVQDKRAFHDSFRDLFSQVSYVLFSPGGATRDTGGRSEEELWDEEMQRAATLAIFLDDLDRCSEKRVVEVLEAINLFLDLPGVCFYLGIDWQRLLRALPEAVRGQGEEFLEKIMQVAFDLPEVGERDAEDYIGELIAGTPLSEVMQEGGGGEPGDVAVLAGALKPRHPRHVKRFLNDLSMGLAVLKNTDKLGSDSPKVPTGAVLAWHLLSEILPPERWYEIRALPANMRVFLREWDGLAEKKESEEGAEALSRLRRSGLLERHIQVLRDLDDSQIHALHLASPPEETARRVGRGGRLELFDLTSDAWVELPGGEFEMGSTDGASNEFPMHRVRLSSFRLARHPVTNADYLAFVGETGKPSPQHWRDGEIPVGKETHPVVEISWTDAEAFCTWLAERLRNAPGEGTVELPTEAQWEYAARGSAGREYPWGDEQPTEDHANFGGQVGDTTPAGSYAKGRTPEGVDDLGGNVWEWCRDWYGAYELDDREDPTGPSSGSSRVVRGGSSGAGRGTLRGAFRLRNAPQYSFSNLGFRVVWSPSGGLKP